MLKKLDWYWKAFVHKDTIATSWSWDAREAMWGYSGDFPTHPTWTYRLNTGTWVFASP
jgi:hypothetical protein